MIRPLGEAPTEPLNIFDVAGSPNASACWRCTDTPCQSLGREKLVVPNLQEMGSILSKTSICPVDALQVGDDGDIEIDAASCIGCGLCLNNCPVGAIYLESSTGVAKVVVQSQNGQALDESIFELRQQWAESLDYKVPTSDQIKSQLDKVQKRLFGSKTHTSNLSTRLLVRNALIALGLTTALRAQGANSLLSEIVAEEDGRVFLVEVETNDDTLDAFRRLISSAARAINALEVDPKKLHLVMVVPQLPNRRVDFYRLAKDARLFLGLRVIVLPMSTLVAAVILRRNNFYETFKNFTPEEGDESLREAAEIAFGFRFDESSGLSPSK